MEILALVLLVLGVAGLGILRRYLRNRDRLRLVEMSHRERMLALEKGLPAADLPAGADLNSWLDEPWTERALEAGWDRRIALAIGLVVILGGVGTLLLALLMPAANHDMQDFKAFAPLAAIPTMAAFGLLLYYRLTASKKA